MSLTNPTPVQIGMTGTFNGVHYRVAGRSVLGVDDGGEIYYWNEFNLVRSGGPAATLVYEETERGGVWRIFTLFEPECPMSAADAAGKQVGDPLNLEGMDVTVTVVDESRVYRVEGEGPEGERVGSTANYFNAEAGNSMFVVSWTGEEVEYYRGTTLPASLVASAFGLKMGMFSLGGGRFSYLAGTRRQSNLGAGKVVFAIIGVVIVMVFVSASHVSCDGPHRAAPAKITAPSAPLAVGNEGTLGGTNYHIRSHAVVEIAQVGRTFERHEYMLADAGDNPVLLVCGLRSTDRDWYLFMPVQPVEPMRPKLAARLQAGQIVSVDGFAGPVSELFQSTIRATEPPDWSRGTISYGFLARTNAELLLVRWNDSGITFHQGRAVPATGVAAAFARKPGK